jgi:CxxC-x17-CxxC domain-containing protein
MSEINFFGVTTYRNQQQKFGIKTDDRRRHFYIIGKTGMGKTALLENMVFQDIQAGRGIGFIDPHGEAAEKILDFVPKNRINDVIYFNPADIEYPIPFNVMERVAVNYRHLVTSGLLGAFKKIWPDVWSARMEYILHNTILALLEVPGTTILAVNRMLFDEEFRKKIVKNLKDPIVKAFWEQEFARYPQRYEVEATAAIQNKIGQFISNPLIRNIVGQVKTAINVREVMDEGKILIVNLSKGRIGEENSMLLGALFITKLQLAAMSRVDLPEEQRRDFYLYVDEFQNFATESFATILSEARKYRLNLILAHQYIAQLDEKVRDAVFGNVGTIVAFRVGAEDAEFLEKEFSPEFSAQDLVNLPKFNIYVKLMIDGVASRPFSAKTLPPPEINRKSFRETIIKVSRERYGVPARIVEEKISKWAGFLGELPKIEKQNTSPSKLYDAICDLCKKWTKVTFPPDGKRPVYCKKCRKKIKKEVKENLAKKEPLPPQESDSLVVSLKNLPSRANVKPPERPSSKKVNFDSLKKALTEAFKKKT